MVYDPRGIFLQVAQHLERMPSMTLTEICNNLGIERHTVQKAVRNATNVTFREFRNTILLKHAHRLLNGQSNLTIKEVAFILGYRSQGSLSRFIRTATGRSAKEFKIGIMNEKVNRMNQRSEEMQIL